MPQSFGQVIPVLGAGVGYPGQWSRTADTIIEARKVNSATNLPFGSGAVLIPDATGGTWQSFADFLATATNAQNLAQYFGGVAIRNVKVMQPFSGYSQGPQTVYSTTATQATVGSLTIVVASAANLAAGQSVEGFGIAANTLVVSLSGTTVTISLPTTGVLSTTPVTFTTTSSPAVGNFTNGTMGEVLVRSSVTVALGVITGAVANSPVYIRTVANALIAGTAIGDFEAQADVATSAITITTTLGSTALTTSAGTGLAPGQLITGTGIAPNTYLVSGATTSWVMSQGASGAVTAGAATFSNTALLGTVTDPWIVFRTGQVDSNNMAEIMIKGRHA